jgi:hypothetical protein
MVFPLPGPILGEFDTSFGDIFATARKSARV